MQTRQVSLTVLQPAPRSNPESKANGYAPASSFRTRSSNVRTFQDCKRQWYLQCVLGYMQIESEAMRFGTKMHLHLEEWLRDAKVPDYSKEGLAAVKIIPLLPDPSPGLRVEHKIVEVLPDGDARGPATVYTGAIDVCDLRAEVMVKHWPAPVDHYATEPGSLVPYRMWDHKSCASLRWAKSREELEEDVSANFYGRHVLRTVQEDTLYCRWNYSERVGSKAEPRDFVLTAESVEARWQKTKETVAEMRDLHYSQKDWTEVAGNYEHCKAYGGCQFQAQCSLQRNQEIAMGLLDHLKGGGEVGKGVAGPSAPAGSEPAQQSNSLASLFSGLVAPQAVQQAPVTLVQPPRADSLSVPGMMAALAQDQAKLEALGMVPTDDEPDLMNEGGEAEGMNFGINPADAAPADLAKDTVDKKTRKKREKKLDADVVVPPTVAAPTAESRVDTIVREVLSARAPIASLEARTPEQKSSGTLLERVAKLEAATGTASDISLEERVSSLEERIARIEELVGA
jgi:hypothetical protein